VSSGKIIIFPGVVWFVLLLLRLRDLREEDQREKGTKEKMTTTIFESIFTNPRRLHRF